MSHCDYIWHLARCETILMPENLPITHRGQGETCDVREFVYVAEWYTTVPNVKFNVEKEKCLICLKHVFVHIF